MANFPSSLDTLGNPAGTTAMNNASFLHAQQHGDANDILEALEAKVGVNSSAVTTSHDYKLAHLPVSLCIIVGDETTAITASTNKITFRMPFAMTLTGVRASLTTTQTSGNIFTVDINEGGASVLGTKLTIDNTEETSTTAAAAATITDSAIADDAEITIDVDQVGDGTAKGLKVYLIGNR